MSEKKRVLLLVLIMAAACMAVTGATIAILYRAAIEEERDVLVSIARNHARLIEEFARIEIQHHHPNGGGLEQTTLQQLIDAHGKFKGIGHTGEFTLAKRDGDTIVFLLSHRNKDVQTPEPIPMRSNLAEPMRRALLGNSGSMVGLDYRGAMVLAAYEPIDGLKWGVVAKVDLAELRIPFARAGAIALGVAVIVVLIGALLFLRITNPIIERIKERSEYLAKLVATLKQSEDNLRRARDELELRVEERTDELVRANDQLSIEVNVRARAEERLRALWTIVELANAEAGELCDHILQGTLQMTQSKYAFYGFLNADESVLSIYSFSKNVQEECRISARPVAYPVHSAGIWAEAIRQRRVLVVNDYPAQAGGNGGLPEGHIRLTRIIAVPVFGRGRIVALVVAANKDTEYDEEDVKQLEAFAGGVQMIIDQREMEKALRVSEKELRKLSRQVIEAQEEERKRVAMELHDSIGQSLAAIKYRAESCLMMEEKDAGQRNEALRSIVAMIRDSLEEARKIQNDLRPAYLDFVGVLESISDLCMRFQATYSRIRVDCHLDLAEKDVPEFLKAPIFRIVQEAMNNAAKHSGANLLKLHIQCKDGGIQLSVEDNGSGFELGDTIFANGQGKGFGLRGMKERAELSGGHFECHSAPGNGTLVQAVWLLETIHPESFAPDSAER